MRNLYKALNMALSMFTIIPLPKYEWDEKCAKHIMKFYPLIGLIIGLLWYLSYVLLHKLQLSLMLLSSIMLVIPFLLTGFLHLDGFMDVCDALLSRRPKEDKLRILKDSTVGAFSVISLVLLLIMEFAAIYSILNKKLDMSIIILIPVVSRCLVAYFMITRDMISESYLGKLFKEGTGKIDKVLLITIYCAVLTISFIIAGVIGGIVVLGMAAIGLVLIMKTNKELGGINGDVAGYILVLSEFIGLLILAF